MGEQESKGLQSLKQTLILELEKRVRDKILENENKELLAKLISNADSITEAQAIMALGTTYKRTGFHFDKRLEKSSNKISYFKKNEELSFSCGFWNKQGEGVKGRRSILDEKSGLQGKGEAEAVEMRNCGFRARNKGVTKAVMTEVEGEESTIYRSNATPLKHTLIIGDNYPALQNLLITYKEKVKVIYIDPPYGKDDLGEFAKTNYHNAITRDNLLSMLYPRLQLAKELLKDDGVIFCSIDDRNQAYVKCLFDEVFGEENFVSNLVWRKIEENTSSGGTMKVTKTFRKDHEYILCYAKQNGNFLTNKIMELPDFQNEYENLDNDPRGAFKAGAITMKGNKQSAKYYEITTPSGKRHSRVWRITKEEFLNLEKDNRIYYGKKGDSVPQLKIFINEERPVTPTTIFENLGSAYSAGENLHKEIFGLADNDEKFFTNLKPIELLKRLIQVSTTSQTQATKEQFTPPPPAA